MVENINGSLFLIAPDYGIICECPCVYSQDYFMEIHLEGELNLFTNAEM